MIKKDYKKLFDILNFLMTLRKFIIIPGILETQEEFDEIYNIREKIRKQL